MIIEELEDESLDLIANIKNEEAHWDDITKISIKFAISVLESLGVGRCYECDANNEIENKIQELKQYLDEKV